MNKKTILAALLGLFCTVQPTLQAAAKPIDWFAIIDSCGEFGKNQATTTSQGLFGALNLAVNLFKTKYTAYAVVGIGLHQTLVRLAQAKPGILDFMTKTPGLNNFVDWLKTTNSVYTFINSIPSLVMTGLRTGPAEFMKWSTSKQVYTISAILIAGRLFEAFDSARKVAAQQRAITQPLRNALAAEQQKSAQAKQKQIVARQNAQLRAQIEAIKAEDEHQKQLHEQQAEREEEARQEQAQRDVARRQQELHLQHEQHDKMAVKRRQEQTHQRERAEQAEQLHKATEGREKDLANQRHQAAMQAAAQSAAQSEQLQKQTERFSQQLADQRLQQEMQAAAQSEQQQKADLQNAPAVPAPVIPQDVPAPFTTPRLFYAGAIATALALGKDILPNLINAGINLAHKKGIIPLIG